VSGAGLSPVLKLLAAGAVLGLALFFGAGVLKHALAGLPHFREEIALAILLGLGAGLYLLLVSLLLGRGWLRTLFKDVGAAADVSTPQGLEKPDPMQDSAALPDTTPPPNL